MYCANNLLPSWYKQTNTVDGSLQMIIKIDVALLLCNDMYDLFTRSISFSHPQFIRACLSVSLFVCLTVVVGGGGGVGGVGGVVVGGYRRVLFSVIFSILPPRWIPRGEEPRC